MSHRLEIHQASGTSSNTPNLPRRPHVQQTSSPVVSSGEEPERGRSRVRRPSTTATNVNLRRRGYHTLTLQALGKHFHVEKRFKLVRELGHGAYGTVISVQDDISGEFVAIKQVPRVFDKISLAKRALREITLLRHLSNHDNITGLIDVDVITRDFNEIYLFMEPMEADLHQIIRSEQALTNAHIQYLVYQILRGLKYIHSAGVIHRDLKPGNLLVNSDCELKICDFGLSRGYDDTPTGQNHPTYLTEYVATRWYRAPEIMLSFTRYDKGIDMWSVGCILAELLGGKPVFKGRDYVDQLNRIIDILGTPAEDTIDNIKSERARKYVRSLPKKVPTPLEKLVPKADVQAVELLSRLLQFNPDSRLTVTEAIQHPWLTSFHNVGEEPECPVKFQKWEHIESLVSLEEFRQAIWNEVQEFRREVRNLTSIVKSPTRRKGSKSRTRSRSNHAESGSVEHPSCLNGNGDALQDKMHKFSLEDSNSMVNDLTDPMTVYSDARRVSTLKPVFEDDLYVEEPEPADNVDKAQSPETHVRARTTSAIGSRLLRSLSTISVHELVEDAAQLEAKAKVARYITEKSAADAPPSELPKEFG